MNKETLITIGQIFESELNEFKRMNEGAHTWLDFEIETKNKTLKRSTVESLSETRIPKNLEKIWLNLYFKNYDMKDERKISIWINFNFYSNSYFTVKGNDPNWVSGITYRLQEIFEGIKTNNEIIRKPIVKSMITLGLLFILGLGFVFLYASYYPETLKENEFLDYYVILLTLVFGVAPFYTLLTWLFPQIEFENYLVQTRIKKFIIPVIGTTIGGLFVMGISILFL